MKRRTLPRRTFLRGAGGIALAVPALEIMRPAVGRTHEGDAPTRYVVAFCGASIGRTDPEYAPAGSTADLFVPDGVGPGYAVKRATQPLADLGVTDEVTIVSGMKVPWDEGNGIPVAGRRVAFHESTMCPLLTGTRGLPSGDTVVAQTSDQFVADVLTGAPRRMLPVKVQAASYVGGSGLGSTRGTLSYQEVDGAIEAVTPIVSPRLLYESLFTEFLPPGSDPAVIAEAEFQLRRRTTVIDLVKDQADHLKGLLGGSDRQRMERHFDELRDLEERLVGLEALPGGACELPVAPGDDAPIGEATGADYDVQGAWSDEETRALVHTDLLHMALACDLTRTVSLMYTHAHCWMNMYPVTGHANDLHGLGHGQSGSDASRLEALSDGVAWNVKHWARLVAKLRDTTDFDGRRMIDNTAIVLLFEGGHGYDPDAGTQSVHSSENMAALIAGRVGGLNPNGGQHIVAAGEHPARVLTSAMHAVGAGDELGEVSGVIAALFG